MPESIKHLTSGQKLPFLPCSSRTRVPNLQVSFPEPYPFSPEAEECTRGEEGC